MAPVVNGRLSDLQQLCRVSSVRVVISEQAVCITDGWNTIQITGSREDILDGITDLQYFLSVAVNAVAEWPK